MFGMTFSGLLFVIGVILFVVFFFGFCVFIHELGHFLAAKWRGLHIVAFSIGFKKAWGIKRGGVEYRIGWIPCGGYVDLPQIDSSEEKKIVDGKELPRAKPIDRIICAAAGPLFNVLFGLLLGIMVWVYGIPQDSPKMREIVVETVDNASPEFKAGLRPGDEIVRINGKKFHTTWMGFVKEVLFTVGKVEITVKRNGELITMAYTPVENPNYFGKERLGYPFFTPRIPFELYPKDGSPAAKAGIKRGDILIKINGKQIGGIDDYATLGEILSQGSLDVTVLRNGKPVEITRIIPIKRVVEDIFRIGVIRGPESGDKVVKVVPDSPAARAGIVPGDVIESVDGVKLNIPEDLQRVVCDSKGKEISLGVRRDGKLITLKAKAEPYVIYDLGLEMVLFNHPNPFQQLRDVVMMSYNSLRGVAYGLMAKAKITTQTSTLKPRHFSGPIGIFNMIYQSVYYGSWMQGIYLIVVITFSLGLINIMPLPVLDGGHIMIAAIEMVIRRPIPHRLLQPINAVFVVFLISFMVYVSFYDMVRLTGKKNGAPEPEKTKTETKAPAAVPAKAVAAPAAAPAGGAK